MTNPPMSDPTMPGDPFERPDGTPPLDNPGEEERKEERGHPSGVPDEDEMSHKKHVSGDDPDMQILEEDPA